MPYSVAKCPKCAQLQTIQVKNINQAVLRCSSCQRQTKVKKADGSMVKLHGFFENAALAIELCKELKKPPTKVSFQKASSLNQ